MELLWPKIEKTESCWLWRGYITKNGYGRVKVSQIKKYGYAHRIVYEILVKEVPKGLQLDHLCRVKACVNPEHLEVVTAKENMLRSYPYRTWLKRGKFTKTHCRKGHEFTNANTYLVNGGKARQCRACHVQSVRLYASKKLN